MPNEAVTRFRVEGMDCASCAAKIDTAVRRFAGVSDVSVSVTAGSMAISGVAMAAARLWCSSASASSFSRKRASI